MSSPREGGAEGLLRALDRAGIRLDPRLGLRLAALWRALAEEEDTVVVDAVVAAVAGAVPAPRLPDVERAVHTWLRPPTPPEPPPPDPWWRRTGVRVAAGVSTGLLLCVGLPLGARAWADPDFDGARAGAGRAALTPAELLDVPAERRGDFGEPPAAPPWWTAPWSLPTGDCAPDDARVGPFATETTNGTDDDCDGVVDLDAPWGREDRDGDGVPGLTADAAGTASPTGPAPLFDLCDGTDTITTVPPLLGTDADGDGCVVDPRPLTRCPGAEEDVRFTLREDIDDWDPSACEPMQCASALPASVPGSRPVGGWIAAALSVLGVGFAAAELLRRWRRARDEADLPRLRQAADDALAERRRAHAHDEGAALLVPFDRLAPPPEPIPTAQVQAAVAALAERELAPTEQLDVRATVEASARAGMPRLVFAAPRTATALGARTGELELWIDGEGPTRLFRARIDALRRDLRTLGMVLHERVVDAAGRLGGRASGHPVLVLSARGRRPDRRAPAVVEAFRACAAPAAWLHPAADARLRPAGLDPALVFPLDGPGLAAALHRLNGEPTTAPWPHRQLTPLDRARLRWLAQRAPWAPPTTLANLLRDYDRETPEAILVAADPWLRTADGDEAQAPLGPAVERDLLARLRSLEPAGADRLAWRRELGQALARLGEPEGTEVLTALAEEAPHTLGLSAGRLAAMPEETRAALGPATARWRQARGIEQVPLAMPTRRAHLAVAALGLVGAALLGARAWVGRAYTRAEDLRLEVGPAGEARVSVPEGFSGEVLLWQAGAEGPLPLTAQDGQWVSAGPVEGCVQASAIGGDTFHTSATVGVQGAARLIVAPVELAAGSLVDLRVGCEAWVRTFAIDPAAAGTELSVPACESASLTWIVAAPTGLIEVGRQVGVKLPAAGRVPVARAGSETPVAIEHAGRRMSVSVLDGGIPAKGLVRAEASGQTAWEFSPGQDVIFPVVPNGTEWTVCLGGDRCASWTEAGQAEVTVDVSKVPPYVVQPLTPDDVPPHEIFVRDPPGGAHAWDGDVLTLKRPADGQSPLSYRLELGGAEAWYGDTPKPENWYDVTKTVEVPARGAAGEVDLRGPRVYGWVQVVAAEPPLSSQLDFERVRTPSGASPSASGSVRAKGAAWLVTRPGSLPLYRSGGGELRVVVGAGERRTVALGAQPDGSEGTATVGGPVQGGPPGGTDGTAGPTGGVVTPPPEPSRWLLRQATVTTCQDDESSRTDRECELVLSAGRGSPCSLRLTEGRTVTAVKCLLEFEGEVPNIVACENDTGGPTTCGDHDPQTGAEDNAVECSLQNASQSEAVVRCFRRGEKTPAVLLDVQLEFDRGGTGGAPPAAK